MVPAGATMLEGYLAKPAGAAKSPAVLIIHDDLGLNQKFRDLAHQFAQAGFVALVPHLPSRAKRPAAEEPTGPRPPAAQQTPVAPLAAPQTVGDAQAALEFLQKDPNVDTTRVSAVGVGWGEFRVWRLAEQNPNLHRAVVFYGIVHSDDDRLKTIKTRVLGHYAQYDYLATARTLKTKKLLGDRFTYFVYPTVPGFMGGGSGNLQPGSGANGRMILRKKDPQAHAAAAKQAWALTIDFLKGKTPNPAAQ
jgi:carboxymethylenebutenolidase